MLINHHWPTTSGARQPVISRKSEHHNDIAPILERLRQTLKSDYVVAATAAAGGGSAVVAWTGNAEGDPPHDLPGVFGHRHPLDVSDGRVALQTMGMIPIGSRQIALTRAAGSGDSLLTMRLPGGPHSTMIIAAGRRAPRSPFTASDERALQRYVDWVADYIAIWQRLHEEEQRRIGFERALDQVGLAIVRLDRDGRTIGTNAAARSLLDAGDGLIAVGETLSAIELEDSVRLHSAIGHALIGPVCRSRASVLSVRRKRRRPLAVAVIRVAADPQPGETAIVLQIVEPDRDHDAAITAACTLFGFTGAEARLAKLLVCGATLAEAAASLRIQMPTARTYLKQAFAKSGTNRQAALVQVLLSSLLHVSGGTVLNVV